MCPGRRGSQNLSSFISDRLILSHPLSVSFSNAFFWTVYPCAHCCEDCVLDYCGFWRLRPGRRGSQNISLHLSLSAHSVAPSLCLSLALFYGRFILVPIAARVVFLIAAYSGGCDLGLEGGEVGRRVARRTQLNIFINQTFLSIRFI